METGAVAAAVALLVFFFIEGMGRFYPARAAWWRMRRTRGRFATRRIRGRIEEASARPTPRIIAVVLLALVGVWIALADRMAKFWYEVALDVLPYLIVAGALFRTPLALRAIAERMREYERRAGEDPDSDLDGGGGEAVVEL
jgi:hypothetical protein